MADITQTADHYPEGIYLLAVTDPVLGGPEGPDNKAPIALANRTNYQRMRNVTPWRSGLGNEYPAHAYVQHGGVTWKSLVANADVEPGTDPAKWIRWAFTQAELDAYMATFLPYAVPAACPLTGPIPTDNKSKLFKSALGEYWGWMGDAWRVTAGAYGVTSVPANVTHNAAGEITVFTYTAHRAGRVVCTMHNYMIATAAAQASGAVITIGGTVFAGSTLTSSNNGQALRSAPNGAFNVAAGDVIAWRSYSGYAPVTTQQIVCGLQYTA